MAKRQLPDCVKDHPVLREEIAVPNQRTVRIFQVQHIVHAMSPGPVSVKCDPPYAPVGLKGHGVVVGCAIRTVDGRVDELRVGAATGAERDRARLRFVDVHAVVQIPVSRTDIRQTEADIAHLPLHRRVELVDHTVLCLQRNCPDVLGRDIRRNAAGWERIRHLEQWHPVRDFV